VPVGVCRVPYLEWAYFQHFQTVKLPPYLQPPADLAEYYVKILYAHCGKFTFLTVKELAHAISAN